MGKSVSHSVEKTRSIEIERNRGSNFSNKKVKKSHYGKICIKEKS